MRILFPRGDFAQPNTKIDDWNKEGYDVNDFFVLASNLVRGFLPIYGEIFQSISTGEGAKSSPTAKRSSK